MPADYTTTCGIALKDILGNDCIGDTKDVINNNIRALGTAVCEVSSKTFSVGSTDTIAIQQVGVGASRIFYPSLIDDSVTTAKLSAQAVTTDKIALSAVTPSRLSQPLTLATAKAFNWNESSSNTFIDFENIPSWVKRITIMFNELSLNGSSISVRLGTSSGIENTNYIAGSSRVGPLGATAYVSSFAGFIISGGGGAETFSGIMHLSTHGSNIWVASHAGRVPAGSVQGGGTKTLAGTLTQVRITTETTTNTIDAGSVNIMYEG